MHRALEQARQGAERGEVPVGAVLLNPKGEVLAEAYNAPEGLNDPSAHAEVLALRRGAEKIGNYRLSGCILVATLEPCLMCLGALIHARIGGLVFGARDLKSGALVSRMDGADLTFVNHRFSYLDGILADESNAMLKDFFTNRRK